jgi:hypothetical protein
VTLTLESNEYPICTPRPCDSVICRGGRALQRKFTFTLDRRCFDFLGEGVNDCRSALARYIPALCQVRLALLCAKRKLDRWNTNTLRVFWRIRLGGTRDLDKFGVHCPVLQGSADISSRVQGCSAEICPLQHTQFKTPRKQCKSGQVDHGLCTPPLNPCHYSCAQSCLRQRFTKCVRHAAHPTICLCGERGKPASRNLLPYPILQPFSPSLPAVQGLLPLSAQLTIPEQSTEPNRQAHALFCGSVHR